MTMDLVKVTEEVKIEIQNSNVRLPDEYSIENAIKAAYLVLRQTVDRNKKPVLEVCSVESIHYAVLDMVIQGLNPIKDQCYFVAFGSKLVCMRGYAGSAMIAKRVDSRVKDIRAEVIYEGDKFTFSIVNGKKTIKTHEQDLTNMIKDRIIGAYAIAIGNEEKIIATDIMTMTDIETSWRQSNMRLFDDSGNLLESTTHYKFKAEMAKKTIIHRLCKPIINQSSDGVLLRSFRNTDEENSLEYSVTAEIAENANQKAIDFVPPPVTSSKAGVTMATKAHAQVIFDLSKRLNQKDTLLDKVSTFIGRKIEKLSELTEEEAENYIDALEYQIVDSPEEI